MPTRNGHANCCGMYHYSSWNKNSNDPDGKNLAEQLQTLQSKDTGKYLGEIVLNDTQAKAAPALLDKMAALGWVFVARFINGVHNSRVNVFHRAADRLPLSDAPFEWKGMVTNPALSGPLPVPPPGLEGKDGPRPRATNTTFRGYGPVDPDKPIEFEDGTPARLLRRHSTSFDAKPAPGHSLKKTVEGRRHVTDGFGAGRPQSYSLSSGIWAGGTTPHQFLAIRNVGVTGYIPNWTPEQTPADPYEGVERVVPEVVDPSTSEKKTEEVSTTPNPPYRHEGATPPIAATPIEVIFSTFHNVFRDGSRGAGFDTVEAARAAAPRAQWIDRRDIKSDKTFEWHENVGTE